MRRAALDVGAKYLRTSKTNTDSVEWRRRCRRAVESVGLIKRQPQQCLEVHVMQRYLAGLFGVLYCVDVD